MVRLLREADICQLVIKKRQKADFPEWPFQVRSDLVDYIETIAKG
jgi:hypothetical protein